MGLGITSFMRDIIPTQADRERAWPFRPDPYVSGDKGPWLAGNYDHVPLIRAFAAHAKQERERCASIAERIESVGLSKNLDSMIVREIIKAIRSE